MTRQATDNLNRPLAAICPGTVHVVAVGAAAASTGAFGGATTVVRIVSTVDCYYVGSWMASAATSSHSFLPAGVIEYVNVAQGSTISIIRSTGDGTARVTEGA